VVETIPVALGQEQDDLRIIIDKLTTGWVAMKLSSSNYPKERTIVVDQVAQMLSWKKGSKVDGTLNLDAVKRITRGRNSITLEKLRSLDASLCLSVHYLKTSLDLQLSSETERNMMYFGLKEMLTRADQFGIPPASENMTVGKNCCSGASV
jgi:predicted RNase H-related nuclease YkuK (DUF458 family)